MKKTLLFSLLYTLAIPLLSAQYQGPKEEKVQSEDVAWVIDHANFLEQQDARIYLSGYIVRQVSKEKYIFQDASGQIRVEIEEENLPAQPFDDRTKVIILGELETQFLESPEIDVYEVTIIVD